MKYLLFCCLIMPVMVEAQNDSALIYSEVVIVDSATPEKLFAKAGTWLHISFKDFKVNVSTEDKEYGHVGGKGYCNSYLDRKDIRELTKWKSSYTFSFDIWVVGEKYKYAVTAIYNDESQLLTKSTKNPVKYPLASQARSDEIWSADKKAFNRKIQLMIASLKAYMESAKEN